MKTLTIALLAITVMAAPLDFEVATVKAAATSGGSVRLTCHGIDSRLAPEDRANGVPLGRCSLSAARVSHIMSFAYGVDRVGGGPEWATSGNRFDIEAKAEDPANTTESQLLEMLQSLLAQRFKLKFHRETRELPGFILTTAKGGPKFRNSESVAKVEDYGLESRIPQLTNRPPDPHGLGTVITLHAKRFSMADLSQALRKHAGGPIEDKTGLTGLYDLEFTWEAGVPLAKPFRDQLGLILEPAKLPLEFLVIDSVELPERN